MEGIGRLHEIAEDVGRTVWLRELGAALSDTADAIARETEDISGYESDVLAWVEKNGGLEAVKERLAPKVLDADGEPLEVGQTVWDTNGDELVVGAIEEGGHTVTCRYVDVGDGIPVHGMWSPSDLTHERPVLDADGVPLHEGDVVWDTENGRKLKVLCVAHDPKDGFEGLASHTVLTKATDWLGLKGWSNPKTLTHTKPEMDTWERIEKDVDALVDAEDNGVGSFSVANDYCERHGLENGTVWVMMARDLVRRAKKLAGVDYD